MSLNLDGDLAPVISVDFTSVKRQQKELAEKRATEVALTIVGVHAVLDRKKKEAIAYLREIRKREKDLVAEIRKLDKAGDALAASIENQDNELMKHVADAAEAMPGSPYTFLKGIASQHISSSVDIHNFMEVMRSLLRTETR